MFGTFKHETLNPLYSGRNEVRPALSFNCCRSLDVRAKRTKLHKPCPSMPKTFALPAAVAVQDAWQNGTSASRAVDSPGHHVTLSGRFATSSVRRLDPETEYPVGVVLFSRPQSLAVEQYSDAVHVCLGEHAAAFWS